MCVVNPAHDLIHKVARGEDDEEDRQKEDTVRDEIERRGQILICRDDRANGEDGVEHTHCRHCNRRRQAEDLGRTGFRAEVLGPHYKGEPMKDKNQ